MKTKTGKNIECKNCGKEFYVHKCHIDKRLYCSSECFGLDNQGKDRPDRKKGKNIECKNCGKVFYVPQVRVETACCCSRECQSEWQKCKKIKKICKICNTEFEVYPSNVKQSKERGHIIKYCSQKCRDLDPETKEHLIKMNELQSNAKGLNKLEAKGNEILNDIGVQYETQYLIGDKFLVDVFIPEYNIVIQWDGDYWHGHESKIKESTLDKRQAKRMGLDKSQDAYMKKMGLKVLRFWEHQVHKNRKEVYEYIRNTISGIA